jgi:hypothetical protein
MVRMGSPAELHTKDSSQVLSRHVAGFNLHKNPFEVGNIDPAFWWRKLRLRTVKKFTRTDTAK